MNLLYPGAGMNLVYLIGPPAAGKSTLMRTLTAGLGRSLRAWPITHEALTEPVRGMVVGLELGRTRERFSGTDALPLNVAPAARVFIGQRPAPLVLAEGDRLAHHAFLQAAADADYTVTVAYLQCYNAELDRRCAARGSAQSHTWRTGRATKAARLAAAWQARGATIHLDALRPPRELAAQLRQAIPALRALGGEP